MKRGGPLKRKTPLRARRSVSRAPKKRSKYASRERAPVSWWQFVKLYVGCSVPAAGASVRFERLIRYTPCGGAIEADHDVADGLGRKSKDHRVWAICTNHHRERTDHTGAFRHFAKVDMRDFREWAIARTHRLADLSGAEIPTC